MGSTSSHRHHQGLQSDGARLAADDEMIDKPATSDSRWQSAVSGCNDGDGDDMAAEHEDRLPPNSYGFMRIPNDEGKSVERRDQSSTSARLNILRSMSSPVALTGLAQGVSGVSNSLVGYRHFSSTDVGSKQPTLEPVIDEAADEQQRTSTPTSDWNHAGRRRNFPAAVVANFSLRTVQLRSSNYSQMCSAADD